MRIDLTLRGPDGEDHDVAVVAPPGTALASVPGLVSGGGAAELWIARRRLRPELILGRRPLVDGAIINAAPSDDGSAGWAGRIEIVGGPGAGHGVTAPGRVIAVGRAASCELVLPDPTVSRRHAELDLRSPVPTIRDLASTHGTTIDGVPLGEVAPLSIGTIVRLGNSYLALATDPGPAATLTAGPDGLVVNRARRRDAAAPEETIHRPPAPVMDKPSRTPWLAAAVPAIGAAVLAAAMHSVLFLGFAALAPVTLVAGAVGDRAHRRRSHRRAMGAYRRALAAVDALIADRVHAERTARRRAAPDPSALSRIACTPGARVWERQRADGDLLTVRLGLATLPSRLRVRHEGAERSAAELAAVPLVVDLADGAVGLVGPPGFRRALARWLIGQLATLVSPHDLELVLVSGDEGGWRWLRWLPHFRTRSSEADVVIDELNEVLRERRAEPGPWQGSRLVVIVDHPLPFAHASKLAPVLAAGAAMGVTALCLAEHPAELPGQCVTVARACSETEIEVGGTSAGADQVDAGWAERVARGLAPLRDGAVGAGGLPASCRLADLPGCEPEAAGARWQEGHGGAETALGVGPDGPFVIDLDRDGPHVLVAGTTGSGKSELLQTLVTGLAGRYRPDEMTFLLVDYKGGAAFAGCAELPHTVGLVTDLDDRLTLRVLTSLDAEIRRRERLLAAAGAADLRAYRAGGGSLARLVLVVDEFATLADDLAGFVPGLLGIAQRGRSLGLHLVLATQRPAGVVSPQIRANTALRIALRVTSASESVDVIDGPEAAAIPRDTPGRAYARLGGSTVGFQTARVAGPAPTEGLIQVETTPLDGWRRPLTVPRPDAGVTDLQRYVGAIRAAAVTFPAPRRPWLPALGTVGLDAVPTVPGAYAVGIGVLDRPAEQRQEPLTIDLHSGSLLVAGSARSGRTSALVSLAVASTRQHSPRALHVHAIISGTGLSVLRRLPHLGTLAELPAATDLAARLIERLLAEVHRRRHGPQREPMLLLLIDNWEAVTAALDDYDGGRSLERLLALLREAPGAGGFLAIAGDRGTLNPRLTGLVSTRLVLRFNDPADYVQAGLAARSVPSALGPGRGLRVGDALEFQLAQPAASAAAAEGLAAAVAARWSRAPAEAEAEAEAGDLARLPLRLRPLPGRVQLSRLGRHEGRWVLGLGGDLATQLVVDPAAGARQLLIAGPPRSGRSTALRTLWLQSAPWPAVVAAPTRSPLVAAARESGVPWLGPGDDVRDLHRARLLLIDDAELFADTPLADALTTWIRSDHPDRITVVAGRTDALAVLFRGPAAQVRQSRVGILLQPGPVDGDLLGLSLPRTRARAMAGRGVLVPDPAWGIGDAPQPIQVAMS